MSIFDKIGSIETRGVLFPILVTLAILVGGVVEVVPPFFLASTVEKIESVKPYTALELAGRDVYIREGCNNCHSQMVRPFKWETDRFDPNRSYGDAPYSKAGEYVYDFPHLWGSKRTGPDLWHESQINPDPGWHRRHFMDPRSVEPESIMPAYPWIFENKLDPAKVRAHMEAQQTLMELHGITPTYTEADFKSAEAVAGKTEGDALIAYMLKLGRDTANTGGAR